MAKQNTLGKEERLKSRKQIEMLFNSGKKFSLNPYRVFYTITRQSDSAKSENLCFGIAVSAKKFKRAADRNRIKRQTKEAWRLQKKELKEFLELNGLLMNVFLVYTSDELTDSDFINEKLSAILKKLYSKTDEENLSDT